MTITNCLVFENLYYDNAGLEISPRELRDSAKPVDVWNSDGKYLGKVLRVWRNADNCLEALIEL